MARAGLQRMMLLATLVVNTAGCAGARFGLARTTFTSSSLDHNGGEPHSTTIAQRTPAAVADLLIAVGRHRELVLVKQSGRCDARRCELAFRSKPIDKRVFRASGALRKSYYARLFFRLRRAAGGTRVSAWGAPVFDGRMACPRRGARLKLCRPVELAHARRLTLTAAVRRDWGYDISGGNEAELVAGMLAELGRASGKHPTPTGAPSTRPAPTRDERARRAARLKRQGRLCFRVRDYRCALEKFRAAHALTRSAALVYNIAAAEDRLGRAVAAVRHYRQYLAEEGSPPKQILAHLGRRLQKLLPRVGRLRLAVAPAGVAVRVRVDGAALRHVSGQELVLAPGAHRIEVVAAGYAPCRRTTSLRPGKVKTLEIALVRRGGNR